MNALNHPDSTYKNESLRLFSNTIGVSDLEISTQLKIDKIKQILLPREQSTNWQIVAYNDFPGYEIKPHRDMADKTLTILIYLNKLPLFIPGTNLLKFNKVSKNFETYKYIKNRFNKGFAFSRSELSWHSVNKFKGYIPFITRKVISITLCKPGVLLK